MKIDLKEAAERLLSRDHILILTHKNPDGDTLGSGYALCYALQALGKEARVVCSDPVPRKYWYFTDHSAGKQLILPDDTFQPDLIVASDIADTQLFGTALEPFADRVDLCVDHHKSNVYYARETYVDDTASATCEIVYDLLQLMGAQITPKIADCLYTGIATDTGCFKFSNTTGKTHVTAAHLIDLGADYVAINRVMFDTKSRERILLEQMALNSIEFAFDNRCAIILVSQQMMQTSGADESDLDGVSALPRQIEGVEVGITIRERAEGGYKVSMRTTEKVDASVLCQSFGGGGHARAAGCTLEGTPKEVVTALLKATGRALEACS